MDECAVNNGGCSQICSDTIGGFSCECYTGYVQNQLNTSSCYVPGRVVVILYDHHLFYGGLQGHVLLLGAIILVCWTPAMLPRVSVILVTCCPMRKLHALVNHDNTVS